MPSCDNRTVLPLPKVELSDRFTSFWNSATVDGSLASGPFELTNCCRIENTPFRVETRLLAADTICVGACGWLITVLPVVSKLRFTPAATGTAILVGAEYCWPFTVYWASCAALTEA